ncbi:MAG: YafY family transcriptional regulator [Ruminococcaceae bacterium]|nr:YafY family transcriptional regulator [Oscillospiraceae bacterium]
MKINRHIGILSLLLQKDKVTAAELSEKFEVSRRTIARDIDDICMAGIPIVTTQGKDGGISIMEGYKIDRILLLMEDLKAIFTGLKGLDSVSDSPSYRQLMDKLSAENSEISGFGDEIIIDLAAWDKSAVSGKIELIKNAVKNGEKITFKYYSPNGESVRTIEPYHLIFQWSSWYVWGYCTTRQDYRLFKLMRLFDLRSTGEKCEPRDVPPYKCERLWHLNGQITATVRFDSSMKWRVIDEYSTELPRFNEDGSSELTITWSDKQTFFGMILSYGDKAEIISPPELRDEFSKLVKKISEIYKI